MVGSLRSMGIQFVGAHRDIDTDARVGWQREIRSERVSLMIVMSLQHKRDRARGFVEHDGRGGVVIELMPIVEVGEQANQARTPSSEPRRNSRMTKHGVVGQKRESLFGAGQLDLVMIDTANHFCVSCRLGINWSLLSFYRDRHRDNPSRIP